MVPRNINSDKMLVLLVWYSLTYSTSQRCVKKGTQTRIGGQVYEARCIPEAPCLVLCAAYKGAIPLKMTPQARHQILCDLPTTWYVSVIVVLQVTKWKQEINGYFMYHIIHVHF